MDRRKFLKTSSALAIPQIASANQKLTGHSVKPKAVLVLGGTGFFGPVVVDELINKGHIVTLCNRGITNPDLFPGLQRIIVDRETKDGSGLAKLKQSTQEWDWVVDTWQGSSMAVQDTAILLNERVKQYQYVSTVSVYDKWDNIGINENEPLNPLPPGPEKIITPHRYALRKTFAEQVLRKLMPTKSVFFRSHGMRGYPTTAPKNEPYWQVKIARGKNLVLPADIKHYQVTDMVSLAKFMLHCGEELINGPFNVCYPPFLFRDFIHEIVAETNSKVDLHWIPQEFLLANDVTLMRETPVGRYRFSVNRALEAGLVNRPLLELLKDQLRGYTNRNPDDNFEFGKADTATISEQRELEIIDLWHERVNS